MCMPWCIHIPQLFWAEALVFDVLLMMMYVQHNNSSLLNQKISEDKMTLYMPGKW